MLKFLLQTIFRFMILVPFLPYLINLSPRLQVRGVITPIVDTGSYRKLH
jgi:hypothetical protein